MRKLRIGALMLLPLWHGPSHAAVSSKTIALKVDGRAVVRTLEIPEGTAKLVVILRCGF